MYAHVDWISFSLYVGEQQGRGIKETCMAVRDAMEQLHPQLPTLLGIEGSVSETKGHKPYSLGWICNETFVRIYAHPRLSHALVDITGQACERLETSGALEAVLQTCWMRVTRVDVATDIETETTPDDFAGSLTSKRFKAAGQQISEDGHTIYVGSRKSERYCKVYRYNPPHPRAHLLRVEVTLKNENAKLAAAALNETPTSLYAAQLGNVYGWTHPDWKPDHITDEKPATHVAERAEGKTIFWLNDTVAPLLARMHREGVIDVQSWFADNVLRKI